MITESAAAYSVRYDIFTDVKPPSFMPNARLIARHRKFGMIRAFETRSEPFTGGVQIIAEVPTMEIATDLDIGWYAEGCFLPLVPDDGASR